MYESPSWSPLMISRSSKITGLLQKPWTLMNSPTFDRHFSLPSKSYAATMISPGVTGRSLPTFGAGIRWPSIFKNVTYTNLPSVEGVLVAWLFSA